LFGYKQVFTVMSAPTITKSFAFMLML
jgi:hypothetical protein